jgi:hypothetical protein
MTVSGDSLWPSAGIFVAAVVEIFVAADMMYRKDHLQAAGLIEAKC